MPLGGQFATLYQICPIQRRGADWFRTTTFSREQDLILVTREVRLTRPPRHSRLGITACQVERTCCAFPTGGSATSLFGNPRASKHSQIASSFRAPGRRPCAN